MSAVERATDPHGIVALDDAECHEVLASQRLCVMAVVDGNEPYAVPLFFGFDGRAMYLGLAEGRKTRALDANPRVCVVVTEVGSGGDWRSVEVAGRATMLMDAEERRSAIAVLTAHNRRAERHGSEGASTAASPRTRSGGRVLQIDDAVISGRARRRHGGSENQEGHEPPALDA